MLEGEGGLVMAGLLAHKDMMNLYLAIFVAGLGGLAGEQVHSCIGRSNKEPVHRKFRGPRRAFAVARLLLKRP
ncbi:DedA family protein, partial [Aliarcobacter butzleri]